MWKAKETIKGLGIFTAILGVLIIVLACAMPSARAEALSCESDSGNEIIRAEYVSEAAEGEIWSFD